MKFTQYFLYTMKRPDRAKIRMEWIEKTIKDPDCSIVKQITPSDDQGPPLISDLRACVNDRNGGTIQQFRGKFFLSFSRCIPITLAPAGAIWETMLCAFRRATADPRMKDRNHNEIVVARTRGGVIVTAHRYDNLVRSGIMPWPPPEIVQKPYQIRQIRAFHETNRRIWSSGLGYYCDLRSMHSEDAITWSVFGTVARAHNPILTVWLTDFLRLIHLDRVQIENREIFLWRRIPHPDTLVSGGPEIGVLEWNIPEKRPPIRKAKQAVYT